MKLNQNKKDEILQLDSCSKNLLIWIQLQALQEDKIKLTYSLYSKDVKVSLNTFKKSLGGLLDSRILYATSKKGWYRLNEEFFVDSYFYHSGLGDFNQNKVSKSTVDEAIEYINELRKTSPSLFDPILTLRGFKERQSQMVDPEYLEKLTKLVQQEENKIYEQESLVKLKPEIVERLKTESIEDIKKDLLK